MKLSVEQIPHEDEEEVIVRCYDTQPAMDLSRDKNAEKMN